nr:alpha/beta hydrolase [Acetobacter garciniae]
MALATCLLGAGCSLPVSVQHLSLTEAYRQRSESALDGRHFSTTTRIVLERQNLWQDWADHPAHAIATLRASTQAQFYTPDLPDQLFALAELNYHLARKHHDRAAFLAAALYAYAYLAPDAPPQDQPSRYDIHIRQAGDIYMLGLTEALGTPVDPQSQRWTLPFGTLDLRADPTQLLWHGYRLTDFQPTARLVASGIKNNYSKPGLGEPLAAVPIRASGQPPAIGMTDKLRVPVNLLMAIPDPRRQVLSDHISGSLVLSVLDAPPGMGETTGTNTAMATPATPPLQYDQTTAQALSLNQAADWSSEYEGFLDGSFFDNGRTPQLYSIEPHRYGRRPVVLVHGTASSPGRWADMINDLLEDPDIQRNFEFWLFSYATGNPIPYSALQLREALRKALDGLGGTRADPALGHITLIGHSQGGLLAKMLSIDPHDRLWNGLTRRPLDSLNLSDSARTMLRKTLFPTPMPEIRSVVFIATPQHGSYLAALSIAQLIGRMVSFPLAVTEVTEQLLKGNGGASALNIRPSHMGSVYGMSPHSAFIRALASTTVVPEIGVHSIIPVLGDGPLATADDGVVTYRSAHIAGARSELVVRHSDHSTQANPITIAEVRRILLEQLAHEKGALPPQVETTRGETDKSNITRIGGEYIQPAGPPAAPTPPAGVKNPS